MSSESRMNPSTCPALLVLLALADLAAADVQEVPNSNTLVHAANGNEFWVQSINDTNKGSLLVHDFSEFDLIGTQKVIFWEAEAVAANISNIIARIRQDGPSKIAGTIETH